MLTLKAILSRKNLLFNGDITHPYTDIQSDKYIKKLCFPCHLTNQCITYKCKLFYIEKELSFIEQLFFVVIRFRLEISLRLILKLVYSISALPASAFAVAQSSYLRLGEC